MKYLFHNSETNYSKNGSGKKKMSFMIHKHYMVLFYYNGNITFLINKSLVIQCISYNYLRQQYYINMSYFDCTL